MVGSAAVRRVLDPRAPVAVVGAGTMGAGIAEVAATAGRPVLLYDAAPGRAEQACAAVVASVRDAAQRGRADQASADAVASRLQPVPSLDGLAAAAVVVESVAEDLAVKRGLLASLERVVDAGCVLATNSSSLSVTAVAAGMERPSRVAGLHFFNPAPRMRLVEVVAGLGTASDVVEALTTLARDWGKVPVRVGSSPGFLVNRVARPFYGEALHLLDEGCADVPTIDRLLREAGGFPLGPFELTDLIGQDVNAAVNRSVWEGTGFDARYRPSWRQDELVAAGRLGRKTGVGFYSYGQSQVRGAPAHRPTGRRAPVVPAALSPDPSAPLLARLPAPLPVPCRLTDGRTATQVAADGGPPVVLDLAADLGATPTIAFAVADGAGASVAEDLRSALAGAGVEAVQVDDVPGLVVMRTVTALVDAAVAVVSSGVACPDHVDTAMRLGAGYPVGPLEWGDLLGPALVLQVLDNLEDAYRDGRHRASALLRRRALSGASLRLPRHGVGGFDDG